MPILQQIVKENVKPRVLVVEDDLDVAAAATRWLEAEGIEVVHSDDASRAQDLSRTQDWNLVISDIELPDANGLDLVKVFKQAAPNRPMLLMTSHQRCEYAIRAIQDGADDYLLKPLKRHVFIEALNRHIERSRSARRSILAIGAHPDDVEIGVGGLLLKHRAEGDAVHILTLTGGEAGGAVGQRRRESEDSARLIGASLHFGDLPDTAVSEGSETIRMIREVIDQVKPDVIYTHTVHDAHQDHRAVHRATIVASRGINNVYCYLSPSSTIDFRPNQFADIGVFLNGKLETIDRFGSQTQKAPYLDRQLTMATARYWGRFAGYCEVEPLEVVREAR